MKLPIKITLLLFAVITLFIVLLSSYSYTQINQNFTRQSESLVNQSTSLLQQRIHFLQENLKSEMDQLSASFFSENETTLAAMLKRSPEFNTDVVAFAEKLRRRTSLNYLYVISQDGIILSNSLHPAAFGKSDPHPDAPFDRTFYVFEETVRLELKKKATFGKHTMHLRGGYFLKEELQKLPLQGMRFEIFEFQPGAKTTLKPDFDDLYITSTIVLKDYNQKPVTEIVVGVSKQDLIQQKQNLIRNSILFLFSALLVCLIISYLLSFSISRPISHLRNAAQEMSSGNLAVRVEEDATGEVGELLHAFNRMAEQLGEKEAKLIQTERIAAWQEIARHLAHEIKNPLTPIRTSIANLRLSLEKAPQKFPEIFLESTESILQEVDKLRHLADEFSRFARLPAPNLKKANLNEIIQKCLVLYGGESSPQIQFNAGDLPLFHFDSEQLSEVIHNLLQNSVDAINSDGMINVFTSILRHQNHEWARLQVQDNGRGMSKQVRSQIFTPYFTTKNTGTGLGLAIVQRIITEHGGKIFVESDPDHGTTIDIRLPVI